MKLVFTFLFCLFSMAVLAQQKKSSSASQTIHIRLQKIDVVDASSLKTSVNSSQTTPAPVISSSKWLAVARKVSELEQPISASTFDDSNSSTSSETTVYTLTPQ